MSKHTPGPWNYTMDKERGWDFKLTADHGKTAIVSGCGCCDSPWVSCEADARLIAAAPDLLEALVDFIKLFGADDDPMLIDLLNKARAAITKAKGHTVQETDRLRAKKKQIYEDLQGAVNVSVEGLRSGEEWQARARAAIAKAKGGEHERKTKGHDE